MALKRSSNYDGFGSNFERDFKAYFRLISSQMKSQSNFRKLAIKYKIGLKLFLFFTSGTQNICSIKCKIGLRLFLFFTSGMQNV